MISLKGMYDLHIHPAPSIQRRKFTALEALRLADAEGMGGILLLDHCYNTTVVADILNEMGYETKAFGSILLNESVGGLSPSVVEVALGLGTKQIQMPTYSSKNHLDAYGDDQKIFPYRKRAKPVYILDADGRLIKEVEDILELLKTSSSFLGTGHLSILEVEALVSRAKELRCKVVVNSVSSDMLDFPIEAQKRWADDQVFMEHDYMAVTEVPHRTVPVDTIVEQIRAVGAERCVIGTDVGNLELPDNVHAMKDFVSRLMKGGITEKELDLMARTNPRFLLAIP
jgi:hypothetical protein